MWKMVMENVVFIIARNLEALLKLYLIQNYYIMAVERGFKPKL
jgi:hypothetical protein